MPIRAMPSGASGPNHAARNKLGELRRHHAVGRGDARIAPVQIRHDQLQIVSGMCFRFATSGSVSRICYTQH